MGTTPFRTAPRTPRFLIGVGLLAGVLLAACDGSASADVPAVTFTSAPTLSGLISPNDYVIGWRFTTNGSIVISALGFYNPPNETFDGFIQTSNHNVGIVDVNTNLVLVSANVLTSDPLVPISSTVGGYRYHTLPTPFVL